MGILPQNVRMLRIRQNLKFNVRMVPRRTGKPGKMTKLFPVREKSGNFEQTGKVREFYPKYWENEGILPKILEKWGNFSHFLFLIFLDFSIEMYLLNRFLYLLNSLDKTLENGNKNTGKVMEICQSENMGTIVRFWKFMGNCLQKSMITYRFILKLISKMAHVWILAKVMCTYM